MIKQETVAWRKQRQCRKQVNYKTNNQRNKKTQHPSSKNKRNNQENKKELY